MEVGWLEGDMVNKMPAKEGTVTVRAVTRQPNQVNVAEEVNGGEIEIVSLMQFDQLPVQSDRRFTRGKAGLRAGFFLIARPTRSAAVLLASSAVSLIRISITRSSRRVFLPPLPEPCSHTVAHNLWSCAER